MRRDGTNSRYLSPPVLKKLFALSHNECGFPRCEERLSRPEWEQVLAEVCHIAGLSPGSAQYLPDMDPAQRNSYENLLLPCPNHHHLIDVLEPNKYTISDLLDMKKGHEERRAGDDKLPSNDPDQQDALVIKLVATHGLVLLAPGQEPRELIRSGTPMPESVLPQERRRSFEPKRPNWAKEPEPEWPTEWLKTPRVRDIAHELGVTQKVVMELCDDLGVPHWSKETRLSEPYADMVRRRAVRRPRPHVRAAGIGPVPGTVRSSRRQNGVRWAVTPTMTDPVPRSVQRRDDVRGPGDPSQRSRGALVAQRVEVRKCAHHRR